METFFTADTHFFHRNVIKYDDRPFETLEEMNNVLIKKWNKVVKGDDIIYHLGDISFGSATLTKEVLKKLKGRKRLVRGNHDYKSDNWYRDAGFEKVYDKPVLWNEFYLLSHEPLTTQLTKDFPMINLHGHIHQNKIECSQFINVGCMHWDWKPVNFKQLVNKK